MNWLPPAISATRFIGSLLAVKKLFERGGQVRLVCDDAVDQAALGQLGLGGGDNARPAARGRADGGIHRAAAQI